LTKDLFGSISAHQRFWLKLPQCVLF